MTIIARTIRRKHAGHLRVWAMQKYTQSGSGYIYLPVDHRSAEGHKRLARFYSDNPRSNTCHNGFRRQRNQRLRNQQNQIVSAYSRLGDLENTPLIPPFLHDVLWFC
ncbi:hypothetical protein A4U49_06250 [Acidithiobacillus ferrivorans]|uniref:hypothetical protein n=1 Tax=Acidithiobacillus ferrivorans TaxID=160808 RepID=UPI000892E790|nr:hypothetical protein [Acidithiobacillus ferrivorans]OFA16646.1 hypothetical protein A4U49_06250 [Acidithiobacillus ferrivorans]